MGLGPPIIALYQQLKTLGLFDSVHAVAELGSQNVWCPQRTLMRNLFQAFGREAPPEAVMDRFANWTGAARDLYEHLGMTYACIDVDARFGSLTLDMNFDEVPPAHRQRYDLTTDHGTTEHILNQSNVLKMMHDLTSPGGLILHAVPFTVHLEHGFFNYDVGFFRAIARANGYQTLGVWVGPDWQLGSLVPWHPTLMGHLAFSAKTTHLLVVLQRKTAASEFRPPLSVDAEGPDVPWSTFPYCHVVDVEYSEGARNRFVSRRPGGQAATDPAVVRSPRPVPAVTEALGGVAAAPPQTTPIVVGPALVMLYRQLEALGLTGGVRSVLELGSAPLDCPSPLVADFLRTFGRSEAVHALSTEPVPAPARSRDLYEALGWACTTVDSAGGPETLKLDLEFETVPADHTNRHDLVTNIGTGASLLNQQNVFEAAHAFARPGGLMLHVLPFKIPPRGALFGYQPNFFEALARYNSYRTLGTWVTVDAQVPSLIPWQPSLLDYLTLSEKTAQTLVVLFQKMYANDFCVPFQGCYERLVPRANLARYRMVVDGAYSDGAAALDLEEPPGPPPGGADKLHGVPGVDLVRELMWRVRLRVMNVVSGRLRQALAKPAAGTTPRNTSASS